MSIKILAVFGTFLALQGCGTMSVMREPDAAEEPVLPIKKVERR